MRFHDNHNHSSQFSPDGKQTVDELIRAAERNSLSGITLTDHYDKDMVADGQLIPAVSAYGKPDQDDEWIFDFSAYHTELASKQAELEATGTGLKLLKGIEVGYLAYQTDEIWPFLAKEPFDSIICSVHCVDGVDIYHDPSIYEPDYRLAYRKYLELIVEMLEAGLAFDIVGHYDYITRYKTDGHRHLLYRDFPDHFDRIFRLIRDQGKALELNTRSRYRLLAKTGVDIGMQDPDIYRRFFELGGEFVAVSSDSHEGGNCGQYFSQAASLLHAAGCRYLCHFEKRKAVLTKLEP